jgi:hypothetical protein
MKLDIWKYESTSTLELNFVIARFIVNEVLESRIRWGGGGGCSKTSSEGIKFRQNV